MAVDRNRWRMSEDVRNTQGLIGPNAILQLLPVLEQAGGVRFRDQVMAAAAVFETPSDAGLMPEAPAARMHQALRAIEPELAPSLAWEAGVRTARYIMVHRIPLPAQRVLKTLPPVLAAPLLSRAIAKHSWTFAGSGRFTREGRLAFAIADNPIVRGEQSAAPLCHWHRAVFETLFRSLVDDRLRCVETTCCAMGHDACRFALGRRSDL